MQFYPIRKGQARVQVQVKWVVLQQICQTLMNKPLGMNSMMISKCVNTNAPTLRLLSGRKKQKKTAEN